MQTGRLYVVATPIGNLGDITRRAVDVLRAVDLVAAEDTRRSTVLLNHLGIEAKLLSFHEHNEQRRSQRLIELLLAGSDVALVSDAGTPLISDPGYGIVRACREQGISVIPIPGASAVIAALSASGLPTDRFLFQGFLPRTREKRLRSLRQLVDISATLVFYESSHRIVHSLQDMVTVFGRQRRTVLARELTKQYETFIDLPLAELQARVTADGDQQRGEFVVMVAPVARDSDEQGSTGELLLLLAEELPPHQAARIAARISGRPKRELYTRLMKIKSGENGQ
jgi:16S rRNA (cytidine1402-2'-O)-methyltransferase